MMEPEQLIVGRDKEKEILSECLEKALGSEGQTILISGEAGMGKSTLVEFLRSRAEESGMVTCLGESAVQDNSVPYLPFQKALSGLTEEKIFQTEEFSYFDEVFLISKIGLLISHVSRLKEEGMDEDILGSMLTAVQDFVKDSFGDGERDAQKGGLGKLEYMDTKIFIEHGDLVYLAVVTSGEEHPDMKRDIKKCLTEIEAEYFDILMDWDGDIDSLAGSNDILNSLVDKRYRVKRSLENINIQSERLKVQNKILEVIETHARENGLLLVLEDIHWADESTLLAIPFIVRNIPQNRVMLCMTYRSDIVDQHPDAKDTVECIVSDDSCLEINLESLGDKDIVELASNLLGGEKPPEELISDLKSETQGNPFFVTEATRALMAEGTLFKDRDVWIMKHGPKSSVPKTVVELVSKRLESLDLDSLRLLEYGAILGRRFNMALLASGFNMSDTYIREMTGKLVSMKILSSAGQDDLMFQHSKTQEVIYEGMNARWKRMSHRRAGLTYEEMFDGRKEDVLFNLAYHFSRTLEYDRGIDYCVSAGYKASNNLAPREASQFFERAVELIEETGREDERHTDLNQMLGELYDLDGNYGKALSVLDKILGSSGDDSQLAKAFMVKGRVMQSQSKYDDAIENYEKGISLAEKSELTLLKAKINGYLGKVYLRKGEYEKAMELQKAYLAESQKAGVQLEIGQAYMNLGTAYWTMNDPHMAIRQWETSLEIFVKEGYKQGIANLHDNLGVGYSTIGDMERSLAHYEKSEEIMRMLGDVRGLSMVLLNIGVLYNRLGQYETSLEYNTKSLQIKRKIGDAVGVANIYCNIGANYYDSERYEDAIEFYQKNYELMEKIDDVWGITRALNNIAMAKIEIRKFSEAKESCQHSLEISLKHSFNDLLSYSYLFMGVIASHYGEHESAENYFEKGQSLAETTEDPLTIGMAHLYIARHCINRGNHEKAMDNYAKAHELYEKSHMEADARKVRKEMQDLMEKTSKMV